MTDDLAARHSTTAQSAWCDRDTGRFGSLGGDDRTQSFLMTDVWVERAGMPQLVTRHISPFG